MNTNETANIGSLSEALKYLDDKDYENAIHSLYIAIKKRPFHPEATLQLIDIYLRMEDEISAKSLVEPLLVKTPEWNLANKLANEYGIKKPIKAVEDFKISFCLIVKDEENNIKRCLESLKVIKSKEIIIQPKKLICKTSYFIDLPFTYLFF